MYKILIKLTLTMMELEMLVMETVMGILFLMKKMPVLVTNLSNKLTSVLYKKSLWEKIEIHRKIRYGYFPMKERI